MASELQLLGAWMSPFPSRVKVVLNLKGLSYDYIEQDLKNKSELLLESNPVQKKIPVLIHNGKPICESMIIVQYIDEAFAGTGPSILPSDPYERATARFWAAFIDDKLFSAMIGLHRAKTDEEKAVAMEETATALSLLEDAFKKCSNGKGFFGGDTIGYIDIALGGFMGWFNVSEETVGMKVFDESRTPLLAEWAERFCTADATMGTIQDAVKLVELVKARKAAAAAAEAAAAAGN